MGQGQGAGFGGPRDILFVQPIILFTFYFLQSDKFSNCS